MSENKFDRRELLKGAIIGTAGISLLYAGQSQSAQLVKLSESDPTAAALGYHANSKTVDVKKFPTFKPAQNCANCMQLQPGSGNDRPCTIFAGKLVNVNGWCKVWVQKQS